LAQQKGRRNPHGVSKNEFSEVIERHSPWKKRCESEKMSRLKKKICSIPYYREDEYKHLQDLSDDKDTFSISFQEFAKITESKHEEMERKGFQVVKVVVTVEELAAWTKARGLRIDAESRTRFALEKLKEMISNKAITI
jgi:hypothetical protein